MLVMIGFYDVIKKLYEYAQENGNVIDLNTFIGLVTDCNVDPIVNKLTELGIVQIKGNVIRIDSEKLCFYVSWIDHFV